MTSLSMLELVTFLEEQFSFTLEPEDIRVGHMDTVELVGRSRHESSGEGLRARLAATA